MATETKVPGAKTESLRGQAKVDWPSIGVTEIQVLDGIYELCTPWFETDTGGNPAPPAAYQQDRATTGSLYNLTTWGFTLPATDIVTSLTVTIYAGMAAAPVVPYTGTAVHFDTVQIAGLSNLGPSVNMTNTITAYTFTYTNPGLTGAQVNAGVTLTLGITGTGGPTVVPYAGFDIEPTLYTDLVQITAITQAASPVVIASDQGGLRRIAYQGVRKI